MKTAPFYYFITYFIYNFTGCVHQSSKERRLFQFVERFYSILCPPWTTHCTNIYFPRADEQILWKICLEAG